MEKFEDLERDRQWNAEVEHYRRRCADEYARELAAFDAEHSAHETRHYEWRAWLVIGSGVALVALLWWLTR